LHCITCLGIIFGFQVGLLSSAVLGTGRKWVGSAAKDKNLVGSLVGSTCRGRSGRPIRAGRRLLSPSKVRRLRLPKTSPDLGSWASHFGIGELAHLCTRTLRG
jgi:hypothetical protein